MTRLTQKFSPLNIFIVVLIATVVITLLGMHKLLQQLFIREPNAPK